MNNFTSLIKLPEPKKSSSLVAGSATTGMKVFYTGTAFGNTYVSAKTATTFTLGAAVLTNGTYSMYFFPAGSSCTSGASLFTTGNSASYRKGISIVNEEVLGVTRNKIVRGNPGQSMMFIRTVPNSSPIATNFISKIMDDAFMGVTGVAGSAPFSAALTSANTSNLMPRSGPNYYNSTQQALIYNWILEGARTDN